MLTVSPRVTSVVEEAERKADLMRRRGHIEAALSHLRGAVIQLRLARSAVAADRAVDALKSAEAVSRRLQKLEEE